MQNYLLYFLYLYKTTYTFCIYTKLLILFVFIYLYFLYLYKTTYTFCIYTKLLILFVFIQNYLYLLILFV
jgi:hypothetical protein